ncbi:hypothetical protein GXP70_07225 [Paenibacillus lycopersici]|uniref:Uncharacterized protein n=1 Tax=Paenibacillus lycopersici TaxID=2704462 RepID=A0A6C0FWC6_9BACL|nr:hypothetical protein [Paenibacillus lycopersici]QHT59763.1 hypothetical protein GXP70_07225 [Paenibacillus lycopersici]
MEQEQREYTVEYQDGYGVLYYETVTADGLSEAETQVRRRYPDVTIRAVTMNPHAGLDRNA